MAKIIRQNSFNAWLVCLSAALFFLFAFLQMKLFNSMGTELINDFQITSVQLGSLSAIYIYALAICLIPTGFLLDHFSTRKLLLTGMSIDILGTTLFALSSDVNTALCGRILSGMVHSLAFLGCIKLVNEWLGFATGLVITIGVSGGIIAQAPMTLLVDQVGWRIATGITAIAGLLILALLWLVLKNAPKTLQSNSKLSTILQNLWQTFINRQNWYCAFYTGLLNLPFMLLGALWGTLFLIQETNLC